LVGASVVAGIGTSASADTIDDGGFEAFALGDPLGQFGWTANDIGGYNAAGFDIDIVDPSAMWTSGELGTRALRLSNATTSLAFGNQLQTPSLADEVGETGAYNDGYSGGTRQSRLSGSFDFASATKTHQPGLAITFSPDRGDGARMSFFRITDQADGLQVSIVYVESFAPYNFIETVVATGLPRDAVHHFEFTLDLIDGAGNDVLWTSIGGQCSSFAQSGSWEDYHRNTTEGSPPHDTKTVDSLLIRISTAGNEDLRGEGLLLDNLVLTSSTVPPMPPLGIPSTPVGATAAVNLTSVTVTGAPVLTNACAPVTTYTVSAWPLGGGDPAVFTSTTPTFSFPTPFEGAFTLTMSATSSQGVSAEGPVTLAFEPVFAGEEGGELAATGTDAWILLAAGAVTIVLGAGVQSLRGSRKNSPARTPSRP
jgi:hypothetical protein